MSGSNAGWARRLLHNGLLPVAAILLGAAALRLVSLDYSHFQGDEVRALYPVGTDFPSWLLDQKKGPLQFLVTLAVRSLSGGYNEGQARLPFSLASLLSVYIVYLLVREAFGRPAALWAAALTGSCGLLVALGRIAQYQSLVILTLCLTMLLLVHWVLKDRPAYLFGGLACYALAVLAHYDALTFLPALLLLLWAGFRRRSQRSRGRLVHLVLAGLLAAALVAIFYVPYALHPGTGMVARYLRERVASGLGWETITRTGELLELYLPPLYLPLVALGTTIGTVVALGKGSRPFGPVVVVWFAAPFIFYMFLGGQPRSHVYMYFLPGLILAALGTEAVLRRLTSSALAGPARVAVWAAIISSACITFYMLVEHTVEHPWERKTLLGYELPNLATRDIEGVLGFPYYRGLEQVGSWFLAGTLAGTFDSNERDVTVEYYFHAPRSSPPDIYFDEPGSSAPDYYVFVLRPFSLNRILPAAIGDTYELIRTVEVGGRKTIEIYAAPWVEP
jgi:4-amino-4-deoxy-L-arabinose transferase-like glycosyltransferase